MDADARTGRRSEVRSQHVRSKLLETLLVLVLYPNRCPSRGSDRLCISGGSNVAMSSVMRCVCARVRACVCVCVCPPGATKG